MKLLFAASEAVPLVKTGGLADVVGSLPKALQERGADVRVILPKYGAIPEAWASQFETIAAFTVRLGWRDQYCGLLKADIDGIVYYLIDNEFYFKRGGLYGYGDMQNGLSSFVMLLRKRCFIWIISQILYTVMIGRQDLFRFC